MGGRGVGDGAGGGIEEELGLQWGCTHTLRGCGVRRDLIWVTMGPPMPHSTMESPS